MQSSPPTSKKHLLIFWLVFLICWAGLLWRLRLPHPGLQARGAEIWAETFFLVLLYGYVLLTAYGAGHLFVRLLKLPLLSKLESNLLASVIESSPAFLKNLLKFGLLGTFAIIRFIQQFMTIQNTGVVRYFTGQKSGAQFLGEINNDFNTVLHIQEGLPLGDRVLFLWDGRGYYCDERCIPDDEQSTAIRLSFDAPAPQKLARELDEQGITHLMLSVPDASWFIFYHDPRGWHQNAYDYFTDTFLPACGKLIFQDEGM
jgi:hypothetical protein